MARVKATKETGFVYSLSIFQGRSRKKLPRKFTLKRMNEELCSIMKLVFRFFPAVFWKKNIRRFSLNAAGTAPSV